MVNSIEQRYIDLHSGSAERWAVAREIFPDGVTHDGRRMTPFPIYATHGKGPLKWDVDNNEYIDFWTGHGSMILGHAHLEIVKAVQDQVALGTHLSASSDLEIRWGQLIQELIPSAEKVRFQSSGTESTMMAIRMARAYTGKSRIIKFEEHFHGWNDYLSAGGSGLGGVPQETLDTIIVLPPNDISLVEQALQRSDDIAAIILEPTGAHMGLEPIRPGFLNELRDLTTRTGVVLIFDEVVTGFRISKGGAQAHYGVTPDMTTMAKILGGGLPGGAVAGKADIINMIQARPGDAEYNNTRRIAHNGTFNANPLSAVAGIKALELIATTSVNDDATAAGEKLKAGLNEVLSKLEIPGCATGINSLIFLRLNTTEDEADPDRNPNAARAMRAKDDPALQGNLGLALMNHGVHAGSVHAGARFIMSAAHSDGEIERTLEAVANSLTEVREQGLI
ncbi:MAG: aminotransferase class III-fold pyridoxal phosphate-dependent enzyme [Chloroflexi bacterium]|nr:aminotransferase class III-fold pyridoxal phosphate-dependent enzyme [Chloroflexota bacterium]MDA1228472.1 aminotransferase class III-fold pyridoxal phosphate-dependent enzyme [Chloroflexota bacterium]